MLWCSGGMGDGSGCGIQRGVGGGSLGCMRRFRKSDRASKTGRRRSSVSVKPSAKTFMETWIPFWIAAWRSAYVGLSGAT